MTLKIFITYYLVKKILPKNNMYNMLQISISLCRKLYWKAKYKYVKSFFIMPDKSVSIGYITIWK